MKRKIYFTRHGETEDNVISRLSTLPPGPSLTQKGRDQAEELKKNIADMKISKIYSSPLIRAVETSEILNSNYNVEIVKDERLSELLVGDREGRNDDKVFEELDVVWREWSLKNNLSLEAGPNGETAEQVLERGGAFLDELIKSGESDVLIVAHSGILELLLGHKCSNLEPIFCYENWFRNCQIVETEVRDGKIFCTKWGDMDMPDKTV